MSPTWFNGSLRRFKAHSIDQAFTETNNTGDDNMDLNWVSRKLNKLDNETARLNALMALSAAADKERNRQILKEQCAPAEQERDQQALEDEYYETQRLIRNGICPICKWPLAECDCLPFADAREVSE